MANGDSKEKVGSLNGKTQNSFDCFWEEMSTMLEVLEKSASTNKHKILCLLAAE